MGFTGDNNINTMFGFGFITTFELINVESNWVYSNLDRDDELKETLEQYYFDKFKIKVDVIWSDSCYCQESDVFICLHSDTFNCGEDIGSGTAIPNSILNPDEDEKMKMYIMGEDFDKEPKFHMFTF